MVISERGSRSRVLKVIIEKVCNMSESLKTTDGNGKCSAEFLQKERFILKTKNCS